MVAVIGTVSWWPLARSFYLKPNTDKLELTNDKHQITNKSHTPIFQTSVYCFWLLIIGIYLGFDIRDLGFQQSQVEIPMQTWCEFKI